MRIVPLALLVLCSACAGHRYFAPRENGNGTGPDGEPAAVYPVDAGVLGGTLGEVRVWSKGMSLVDDDDGNDHLELHVGFEIENTGPELLVLDLPLLRCEKIQIGEQTIDTIAPARTEGVADALPGTTTRVDAFFEPVVDAVPRDVSAFAVHFQVLTGKGPVLVQVTPFVPHRPDDRSRHDVWFWGPGFSGYGWGPGFGFGWHGRRSCR